MTTGGLAGLRHSSPDRIEGWEDAAIHDVQLRLANFFYKTEGTDAGTRKKRKRLPRETIDDLQPVFRMLGLGCITEDSGLEDLIEQKKFQPNKRWMPDAEPEPAPVIEPEPDSMDEIPEPFGCRRGHVICVDCGHCVCRNPEVRVRSIKSGSNLCSPCRKNRKKGRLAR